MLLKKERSPSLLSVADPKASYNPSSRETKAGIPPRSLKQKPTEEAAYLLTSGCSAALLNTAWAHLPKDDTVHTGPGYPTSIRNQDNAPQTRPQAHLMEAVLQLWFPLPKCVELLANTGHHRKETMHRIHQK